MIPNAIAAILTTLTVVFYTRLIWRELGFAAQRSTALAALINSLKFETVCKHEYRLCRESFFRLVGVVSSFITYDYISRTEVVTIGMHFLAHGAAIRERCSKFGLSDGPIVRANKSFLEAVIAAVGSELNPQVWASRGVLAASSAPYPFSGCFGAVDGTHIPIRVANPMTTSYRNRKSTISVNTLVVCGFSINFWLMFVYVICPEGQVRWPIEVFSFS